MKTRILYTDGKGKFTDMTWDKPEPSDNEIEVKAVMTGICRSDIDMMVGTFGTLPLNMQGHEGLGLVTKVGKDVFGIKPGDYVATRGEPAYSDYYNVKDDECVVVPEAHPKYILEPVACGINLIVHTEAELAKRDGQGKRLLILGSGFLSWVAYHTLKIFAFSFDIDVVGNSNREFWGDILKSKPSGTYDVIIDLSSRTDVFDDIIYNDNALIIIGSQKEVTTNFSGFLWKACTMVFPSPRTPTFIESMYLAERWITNKKLHVDMFWTKGYNRDTEWDQAFSDGLTRSKNYSRGYIKWD